MFWIWSIYMLLLLSSHINTQPLFCKEDAHCAEGYFCERESHVCNQCLDCPDLNRFVPEFHALDSCIKTVTSCGPCFEGFVNIYEDHVKGKCVSPELLQFESKTFCVYVWMCAAITGSLVVVIFVYVIKNTFVFQIVPNYDPVSIMPQLTDVAPVPVAKPTNVLKQILQFFKNCSGQL